MRKSSGDTTINSNELNKMLPSYLLNEIDVEKKETKHKSKNKQDLLVHEKELKNVR